ncbi:non-heme iron oxygenase ferredoxin subunit [Umezawaea sp. Da 62-37]|uniref:non-heme iron oxygenase ferredoxin subunit n=1 Tax=Umezawaea sp. Da 62-37 TaxID=3075927 RepID=UPI0028F6FC63|nr:non-heme iron oxygenase ferredoxin subunit [Umezawaea sp. Da 62-37]WNV84283.1 non-heme iron oxygenase ferredoxin subunit [Umezawaea sp. Da 62-37]
MIRVCAFADLDERKPFAADVDGSPVVVVRDGDRVHALEDQCSHAAVSLSEGEVTKQGIECWLHGSRFDLTTGEPSSPPASEPVAVYAVEVRDGDVYVAVPQD